MNKIIVEINKELEINRNIQLVNIIQLFKKSKKSIKANVISLLELGNQHERKYSIRHDAECRQQEQEDINTLTEIEYIKYKNMYNELIKLKEENILLKQAIIKSGIEIKIIHI